MKSIWLAMLFAFCLSASDDSAQKNFLASIEQGFYQCADLSSVQFARDLLQTVWDEKSAKPFVAKYRPFIDPESFSVEPLNWDVYEDLWIARVKFRNQISDRPVIAGVAAVSMSAYTCRDGCGWTTLRLEFGDLSSAQVTKLRAWADQAVLTKNEYVQDPVKTVLGRQEDGRYILVCDMST